MALLVCELETLSPTKLRFSFALNQFRSREDEIFFRSPQWADLTGALGYLLPKVTCSEEASSAASAIVELKTPEGARVS
jgi:hypothetical protein